MNIEYYKPAADLASFVKTFIFIESESEVENFVLPDTSVVMALRYSGAVTIKENNTENKLPPATLSGIRQAPRLIHYSTQAANLLVVFQPNGAAPFFNEPLHELAGKSIDAGFLKGYSVISEISEQLAALPDKAGKIAFIEQVLRAKLANVRPDFLIAAAVQKINATQGQISVKQLIEELSISRDAFEKRFRKNVGALPKHFSSIIKLKTAINTHTPGKSLAETALEAGYYDQAHFTREFKTYTGQTPGRFFENTVFW